MHLVIEILILVILQLIFFLILNRTIRKKMGTLELLDEIKNGIDEFIIQLNQSTEDSLSLIEEKIGESKAYLTRAEEKIIELKKNYSSAINSAKDIDDIRRDAEEARRRLILEENEHQLKANQEIKLERKEEKPLTPREQVLLHYQNGYDIDQISSELKMPIGEVELIVSLYKR